MTRSSSTFKESYNRALDTVVELGVHQQMPAENNLSEQWGVSRTTVRAILDALQKAGIIAWSGRSKTVLRCPNAQDHFSEKERLSNADRLPSLFMKFLFDSELPPGTALNESELAKKFDVSSTVVREFLIRFSRFGLIEKNPNRHWVLNGFTRGFAMELFDVREMFERQAFAAFLKGDTAIQEKAILLKAEHIEMLENIKSDFELFPLLDEKFHQVWVGAFDNRFVKDFFELISIVFHYHYRWNKIDEMERNRDALEQHLEIIYALEKVDINAANRAFTSHLAHAKGTLMASVQWDENDDLG